MDMKICSIFFLLLLLFLKTPAEAQGSYCQPVQCSKEGPNVSFPFYLNGQPQDCGVPGFELICRSNTTMIKLPYHRELVVKSISYHDSRFDLLDPGSCVYEVFLNLNLSGTPFKYYYSLKSYTYINCSKPISPWKYSFPETPCLSGPGYHIYAVVSSRSSSVVANWDQDSPCRVVKNVEIPFAYSPYLSGNSFGLGLTWESADSCEGCKGIRNREGRDEGLPINLIAAALSITVLILIVMAALVWKKIHETNVQDSDEPMDEHVLHAKKLLGDNQRPKI